LVFCFLTSSLQHGLASLCAACRFSMQKGIYLLVLCILPLCTDAQTAITSENKNHDSLLRVLLPAYKVGTINIIGNKTTKAAIILREINYKTGDSLLTIELLDRIERSRQNIMNLALFNFVRIDPVFEGNVAHTYIYVTERWYIWPIPVFQVAERNFNVWWEHKDLHRAIYGVDLTHENFRGRKEQLALKFHFGYTHQYGVSYKIPYIDKKQRSGLSFAVGYYRNHEVAYKSTDNELIFYNDFSRWMKTDLGAKINYNYRHGLYQNHGAELQYNRVKVDDIVTQLTYNYLHGNAREMEMLTLSYYYKYDNRDYKAYPLKGYFFDILLKKSGLGILPKEQVDMLTVAGSLRYYQPIYKRFYFGIRGDAKISSSGAQPYLLQRGLGYDNYVRGYEYYVVDGQYYGLLRTNLKYQLLKPHTVNFPFIPSEKFNTLFLAMYVNLFTDAAYVWNKDAISNAMNPLNNSSLFGSGIGLDFVTYYDSILRAELSVNKQAECGFFLHFMAAF
jgi:outer membrane protein assembly factor BamA